jgi:hypothetical protein
MTQLADRPISLREPDRNRGGTEEDGQPGHQGGEEAPIDLLPDPFHVPAHPAQEWRVE